MEIRGQFVRIVGAGLGTEFRSSGWEEVSYLLSRPSCTSLIKGESICEKIFIFNNVGQVSSSAGIAMCAFVCFHLRPLHILLH